MDANKLFSDGGWCICVHQDSCHLLRRSFWVGFLLPQEHPSAMLGVEDRCCSRLMLSMLAGCTKIRLTPAFANHLDEGPTKQGLCWTFPLTSLQSRSLSSEAGQAPGLTGSQCSCSQDDVGQSGNADRAQRNSRRRKEASWPLVQGCKNLSRVKKKQKRPHNFLCKIKADVLHRMKKSCFVELRSACI